MSCSLNSHWCQLYLCCEIGCLRFGRKKNGSVGFITEKAKVGVGTNGKLFLCFWVYFLFLFFSALFSFLLFFPPQFPLFFSRWIWTKDSKRWSLHPDLTPETTVRPNIWRKQRHVIAGGYPICLFWGCQIR